MANKKFSEFTVKTSTSDVDFVVGYDGTDNVRITPANLTGGGGASSLNGLTDCLVDTGSLYVGEVPAGLSGNPQGNTVLGIDAGNSLTTGTNNVAIGFEAGYSSTTASLRTCVGYQAGKGGTGFFNTFFGAETGVSAGNGSSNVGVGYKSLKQLTNGSRNVAVGQEALQLCSASEDNVAVGHQSLGASGAKFFNTAVGSKAGNSITTGQNNTIIGYDADASSATVSNEITLGNSSITALRCAVTSITSLSDERDKSDIKDLEYGLAFIDALQPREFVWDNRAETRTEFDEDGNETEVEFYSANKGKKDFGFIAQEVRELDNDTLRLVYSENEEKLELSYGKLVPILVKAIQELKEEVELLKG